MQFMKEEKPSSFYTAGEQKQSSRFSGKHRNILPTGLLPALSYCWKGPFFQLLRKSSSY